MFYSGWVVIRFTVIYRNCVRYIPDKYTVISKSVCPLSVFVVTRSGWRLSP